MRLITIALFLFVAVSRCVVASPLAAVYLRSEYLVEPLIVATPTPRFSWVLPSTSIDRGIVQSAFSISVTAGSNASAVIWDSGKVASSQQNQVAYGGPPLAPDATYAWTVQWWDGAGVAAPVSAPASFGTAPGDDAAWSAAGAQWIGCTGVASNANQLRVDFSAQPPAAGVTLARATLYISGLGWHIPYVNGARLSRSVFEPAFTHLRLRVLYSAHDVASLLDTRGGNNTLAVLVGNGWPAQFEPWEGDSAFGEPVWNGTGFSGPRPPPRARDALASRTQEELDARRRAGLGHGKSGYERRLRAWLSLRWSDGSATRVVSSAEALGAAAAAAASATQPSAWQCGSGALLADDIYAGCDYDARLETPGWTAPGFNFSTGAWGAAVRITEPGGAMSPALAQPVRVTNELPPCALWESTPGVWVFDFCQNFAGVVRLALPGPTPRGAAITMRHAEALLHPPYGPRDGTLYYGNLRSAEATDTYTTRGDDDGETWEPLFTWHGFRYVSIAGLAHVPTLTDGTVIGLHFHSDAPVVGALAFAPTANTLNQLQRAIVWTQASNILGNPSDCPQRDERMGWTGDSALTAEEMALNFDASAFLTQWAHTLDDSMNNVVDPTFVTCSFGTGLPTAANLTPTPHKHTHKHTHTHIQLQTRPSPRPGSRYDRRLRI
jgi:alpha-L-rhamnosidase